MTMLCEAASDIEHFSKNILTPITFMTDNWPHFARTEHSASSRSETKNLIHTFSTEIKDKSWDIIDVARLTRQQSPVKLHNCGVTAEVLR